MIYRLYDMNTRKKLLVDPDEKNIIIAMEVLFKKNENSRFLIIKQYENRSEVFLGIRSKQMFEAYKQEYEYRTLTGKSCVDLKREILESKGLIKK